ncbi:MAG: sulfite exporter TauE/SafE family protein [Bacteroidota bacterium]
MEWLTAIALVVTGLMVGFINTLAGGGTIISLSLLMFMGLPPAMANGTNRLAVLFQVFTSTTSFKKQGVLDVRKGTFLGIPTVIGSILGSWLAVDVNEKIWERAVAFAMIGMLFFIFVKPNVWLKGNKLLQDKRVSWLQYVLFFFIGIYGGFIHVGVGYFILVAVVLGAGYDLLKANALKVYIVLLYVPFSLAVFMLSGNVNYKYGLIHATGNVAGAWIAAKFAVGWGVNFVKWVLVVVILILVVQSFGLMDISGMIKGLIR